MSREKVKWPSSGLRPPSPMASPRAKAQEPQVQCMLKANAHHLCLLPFAEWEKVPDRADEGPLPPLNAACVAIVQRRTDMHVCHPGQRENLLGLGFKLSRSHHLARAIDDAVIGAMARTRSVVMGMSPSTPICRHGAATATRFLILPIPNFSLFARHAPGGHRAPGDNPIRHAAKTPRATFPTCCAGGEG